MTVPEHHPVDSLVRDYLHSQARPGDGEAMLARVRPVTTPRVRPGRFTWLARGLAIAASVALIALIVIPSPKTVSAAELITAAQTTHSQGRDRCYELTVEIETGAIRMLDLPPIVRKSKIWTRGDQFFLETTPPNPKLPPLVWGQDASKRVWVAMSPKAGLLFEPDEINEPIATACDMMSLRTVTLLSEMLADFDIARLDTNIAGEPYRVEGKFKREIGAKSPKVREVALDLDRRTKEIRKAVVKRTIPAPIAGTHHLTLTFQLLETRDLNNDQYTLGGHLDIGANIFDRREPQRKMRTMFREELIRRFGERITRP